MYKSFLFLTILFGLVPPISAEVSLNFNKYWKEVKESNPTIKEQKAIIRSIEKNPSLEIPAPEVSISQMNEELPFSSKAKMQRTLELSQSIPFPSKFSRANDIKNSNINKSNEEEALLEKTLKEEAYRAFLTYAKNQEIKKVLNEKIRFYQDHLARSKALQVINQAYQTHLLDIELEITSLKSEIKLIEIEMVENISLLNQIRNHEIDDPLVALELPPLASPKNHRQDGLQDHPMQKINRYEIASMNGDWEMAKLDWVPDLNLKLRSVKSFDPKVAAGKEIMIGFTLPFVFPWQRNDKIESLSYKIKSREFKGQQIHNQLKQEYLTLNNKINELWALLAIYKDKSLPLIEKKMKLEHKLTTLDMESLDAHKAAIDQYSNLKLKIIEEEIKYRITDFKLQELVGSNEGKI
jgi:hypothetical protein